MPLFEFRCGACGVRFERLAAAPDRVSCPKCDGRDLERLVSRCAVVTPGASKAALAKAQQRSVLNERDKVVAQAEYERKHRH
jgi:putative FmdB family regulatory protein